MTVAPELDPETEARAAAAAVRRKPIPPTVLDEAEASLARWSQRYRDLDAERLELSLPSETPDDPIEHRARASQVGKALGETAEKLLAARRRVAGLKLERGRERLPALVETWEAAAARETAARERVEAAYAGLLLEVWDLDEASQVEHRACAALSREAVAAGADPEQVRFLTRDCAVVGLGDGGDGHVVASGADRPERVLAGLGDGHRSTYAWRNLGDLARNPRERGMRAAAPALQRLLEQAGR